MELIKTLFNRNRNISIVYLLLSGYCLLLIGIRIKLTNSIFLLFLVWNLFLAFLPYPIMLVTKLEKNNWFKNGILLLAWLLLLPNSFYILTDLVHLTQSENQIIWFDIPFISLFTILGFLSGLQSLMEFEKMLKSLVSQWMTETVIVSLCFLSGFGIYIGRMMRYNSWDIISNPMSLFQDCFFQLFQKESLLFSVHFGIFIYIIYHSKKIITSKLSS